MQRSLTRQLPISLLCAGALLFGAVACSDDDTTSADEPTSTSSTTSTTARATCGPNDILDVDLQGAMEPGTYCIDPDADPSTPLTVSFDVPDGWAGGIGGPAKFHDPDGHTALAMVTVDNIASQACEGPAPKDPPVGPTVDDLAAALSGLAPFEATEPPTNVTFLGHQGKHLKITVPDLKLSGSGDQAQYADCVNGNLYSWIQGGADEPFFGYNAEPGRYDEYWILDVDGTRLMIALNSSPAMPAEDLTEAKAIIDSITFEGAGPRTLAKGADINFVGGASGLSDQTMDIDAVEEGGKVSGEATFTPAGLTLDLQCADTERDGMVIIGGEATADSDNPGEWVAVVIGDGDPDHVNVWFESDDDYGSCQGLLDAIPDDVLTTESSTLPDGDDIEVG